MDCVVHVPTVDHCQYDLGERQEFAFAAGVEGPAPGMERNCAVNTKSLAKGRVMAKKAPAKKRTPNPAFMKPVQPSETLAEVVGSKPIPRTEVTKRLWAYIKRNKLQDARNKRMIKADATLKAVFGGKASVNMFEMTKLVGRHLS
jgi:chromatin remodeling complex protein RSC6